MKYCLYLYIFSVSTFAIATTHKITIVNKGRVINYPHFSCISSDGKFETIAQSIHSGGMRA